MGSISTTNWQSVAKAVKARIDDAIPTSYRVDPALIPKELDKSVLDLPRKSGLLTARELEITELIAVELLQKIWSGVYTSVEVTQAFCKRAAIAHQVTNCLAHVMFDDALQRATELDKHLEETGKPIGALHGLPISVKDHVYLKGTPATAGIIAWADDISEEDALIVRVLREAGAVFHVKTTNPQGLMALETVSNIYGRTTNPSNRRLSPGGSSGGEGALVAMRGSLIGIGTDMGGSIRAPAAFSGVYGLKPSVARNPHSGLAGMSGGMENIIGVVGPLATCIPDLRLFQEVVLASDPWRLEPSLIRMPWNPNADSPLPKKLKIGLIWNDGVVQPHPPIIRALKATAKQLMAAGHEVVNWDTSLHKEIQKTVVQMYFLDAGNEFWATFKLGNEPPVEIVESFLQQAPERAYTIEETWKLNLRRNEQQTKYAALWNDTAVDFILAPANQAAAAAHDEARYNGYTEVWNGLDYTALTFPVTTVQDSDTYDNFPRQSEEPLNARDAYFIHAYKPGPSKYRNCPVALQIIGRRHQEEKMLTMAEVVQSILALST